MNTEIKSINMPITYYFVHSNLSVWPARLALYIKPEVTLTLDDRSEPFKLWDFKAKIAILNADGGRLYGNLVLLTTHRNE